MSSSPTTRCWPSTPSPTPPCCPNTTCSIVDEAHELVDRVTGVATAELSATVARRRARGASHGSSIPSSRSGWRPRRRRSRRRSTTPRPGRIDVLDDEMATYLTALRDAASRARSAIDTAPSDPKAASARAEAVDGADRHQRHRVTHPDARSSPPSPTAPTWCGSTTRTTAGQPKVRAVLRVAPLSVAGLLRGRLFERSTAVLTSATLTVGGSFDAMAAAWGLAGGRRATPEWRGTRRRLAVRPREVRHPLRRRAPAAARARRHRLRRAARRDRRADRRRGRAHARPVLLDARRQGRRRDHARAARHPGAVPGRRHHLGAGAAVRRRRRRRRCSARCRCGRASTCPARRCRWCSSTASRSRAPTTRC